MYGRALFFVVLVVVGAVLPYLLADEQWLGKVENWFADSGEATMASTTDASGSKVTTAGKVVEPLTGFDPDVSLPKSKKYTGSVPVAQASYPVAGQYDRSSGYAGQAQQPGQQMQRSSSVPNTSLPGGDIPLPHLLSFDTTPEWITSNWDRVTTRLGELDLQGWRVPYARRVDDFAGSVTYYFDRARNVQRIVLHGYTSDATEYVQLAKSHYQMQRVPNPNFDLFVATVSRRPIGGMRLNYAPVLDSRTGAKRCNILLELNRNGTEYGMSYEFSQLMRNVQSANALLTPIDPSPIGVGPNPFGLGPKLSPNRNLPRG